MNVIEVMNGRHSTRAFMPIPVEKDKLNDLLEAAARTPSWANSQPWEVFVASGNTLERIRKAYAEKYAQKESPEPETPRPTKWTDAAKKRQQQLHPEMLRDCGEAVKEFGAINQAMFYAPTVIYICMDKILSEWSLYDIGAYSQSVMLAAAHHGLATIPAITLTVFPDVIRRELDIPDNLKITIGIAIGYADNKHAINKFISSRKSLSESVRFFD